MPAPRSAWPLPLLGRQRGLDQLERGVKSPGLGCNPIDEVLRIPHSFSSRSSRAREPGSVNARILLRPTTGQPHSAHTVVSLSAAQPNPHARVGLSSPLRPEAASPPDPPRALPRATPFPQPPTGRAPAPSQHLLQLLGVPRDKHDFFPGQGDRHADSDYPADPTEVLCFEGEALPAGPEAGGAHSGRGSHRTPLVLPSASLPSGEEAVPGVRLPCSNPGEQSAPFPDERPGAPGATREGNGEARLRPELLGLPGTGSRLR